MDKIKNEIISWRKVLKLSATFFGICLIFVACKKDQTDIGNSLQSESLDLKMVDTFTIITYSDELDSMDSDETSSSLLGAYLDPVFGLVECGIVTQLLLSSVNPDLGASATTIVDSIVLSFEYSSILKYGNLDDMTFEVFEITDDLIRDDQTYYTFENPTLTGGDLMLSGSETQLPDIYNFQVIGTDTLDAQLRLHLDPSLGDAFVIANEAGDLASFTTYFSGLYIKVDGSTLGQSEGSVLYFNLEDGDSKLTMYFDDLGTPGEYSFQINSKAARYNKIEYDRTGTDVEALLADKNLGANEFYMQAGAIRAVVEFPYIMEFNKDSSGNDDFKIINRAELFLPVQDFEPDYFNPSANLFIARIVDKKLSEFIVDNNFSSTLGVGNTVSYDSDDKEFRFIMTREIQALLTGGQTNVGYRIYSPNFFASSIERIIFNGPDSPLKERPRLEITYTDY